MSARGRTVTANQLVYDQADFFQSDGFTRVTGLTPSQLTCQLFFQNVLQPWSFLSGAGVTDAQVAAGRIFFVEVAGSPGIYNVRWFPTSVGYWRLIISYPTGLQIAAQEYDVTQPVSVNQGLQSSFIRTPC